jgi:hypothetical protein
MLFVVKNNYYKYMSPRKSGTLASNFEMHNNLHITITSKLKSLCFTFYNL